MKSIPLPVRVAAGLAATAVEQARALPAKIAGLPVTVASQALQVSMRVQQQVTELAIRGDQVLSGLRPIEETPEWATFDEDLEEDGKSPFDRVVVEEENRSNGFHGADPWVAEERALTEEAETGELAREIDLPTAENYDQLSLPQLRARLRRFTVDQLTELLEYERAHGNRPSFVGMLTRRIATVRDSSE
jgi:hypothetical protein